MNVHRFSEDQRRQWVKEKVARLKTVKQICREASISRATLYNWIDEFKDISARNSRSDVPADTQKGTFKGSRPELIQKTSPETAERYRMLVNALAGIDEDKAISKKLVAALIKRYTLTVAQACAVVGIDEALYGYKPRKPEVEDYIVYEALIKLLEQDRTRDFETLYELLLKQYPDWTRKQIKRVYRDGMVYLERKRSNVRWEKLGKAKTQRDTTAIPVDPVTSAPASRIQKLGGTWNLALLEYTSTLNGTPTSWWMLCIVEEEFGLKLNAMVGFGEISTDDLLGFLDKAAIENGVPRKLKVPGKPALSVRELTRWVWQHKMALHTFSLNKAENLEAMAIAEQKVLDELNIESVRTKDALLNAVEDWIDKP